MGNALWFLFESRMGNSICFLSTRLWSRRWSLVRLILGSMLSSLLYRHRTCLYLFFRIAIPPNPHSHDCIDPHFKRQRHAKYPSLTEQEAAALNNNRVLPDATQRGITLRGLRTLQKKMQALTGEGKRYFPGTFVGEVIPSFDKLTTEDFVNG